MNRDLEGPKLQKQGKQKEGSISTSVPSTDPWHLDTGVFSIKNNGKDLWVRITSPRSMLPQNILKFSLANIYGALYLVVCCSLCLTNYLWMQAWTCSPLLNGLQWLPIKQGHKVQFPTSPFICCGLFIWDATHPPTTSKTDRSPICLIAPWIWAFYCIYYLIWNLLRTPLSQKSVFFGSVTQISLVRPFLTPWEELSN